MYKSKGREIIGMAPLKMGLQTPPPFSLHLTRKKIHYEYVLNAGSAMT